MFPPYSFLFTFCNYPTIRDSRICEHALKRVILLHAVGTKLFCASIFLMADGVVSTLCKHHVSQVMPTLAWCFVCDELTAVQGGVLRGAGEQIPKFP